MMGIRMKTNPADRRRAKNKNVSGSDFHLPASAGIMYVDVCDYKSRTRIRIRLHS